MIEEYTTSVELGAETAPDSLWLPTLFPIALMRPSPGAHLDTSPGAPSPVHLVYWSAADPLGEPDLPSVGDLFTYWCIALEEGVYVHEGDGNIYTSDRADDFTWPNNMP